ALRERNLGELQGKTAADMGSGAARGFVSRTVNDPHLDPDGGERLDQFRARVRAWLDGLRSQPPAGDIVVVTHGGVMRSLLRSLASSPTTPMSAKALWMRVPHRPMSLSMGTMRVKSSERKTRWVSLSRTKRTASSTSKPRLPHISSARNRSRIR